MFDVQYDLFETITPEYEMRKEFEALNEKYDNLRKGLFARHNELSKLTIKLQEEVYSLRMAMIERKK